MALVSPTDADGDPNPCYDVIPKFDDVQCTGTGTAGLVDTREGYIRSAYVDADEKLGIARELMGGNPTTFAGSDHGFAPQWYAVNANKVLNDATVGGKSLHVSSEQCVELQRDRAAAPAPASRCRRQRDQHRPHQGVLGRRDDPDLHQPGAPAQHGTADLADLRRRSGTAIRNAFEDVTDPANPGKQVIERIMNKEELRNVDGSDSLHPNRSGDVVVVTRPPYQSDAGTPGQVDRAVPLLRAARIPAGLRGPGEQHQHARGLRAGRPRREAPDRCRRPARRRRRPDAVVPDGHPGAAERPRGHPLRPHQGCRLAPRGHDPRRQRLARPADAARRGV